MGLPISWLALLCRTGSGGPTLAGILGQFNAFEAPVRCLLGAEGNNPTSIVSRQLP